MKTEKEIKDKIRQLNSNGHLEWVKFQSGFKDALLWVLDLDRLEPKTYHVKSLLNDRTRAPRRGESGK